MAVAMVQDGDMAFKFFKSRSNQASVGCAVKTSLHGGSTSQLTGHKRSATEDLPLLLLLTEGARYHGIPSKV